MAFASASLTETQKRYATGEKGNNQAPLRIGPWIEGLRGYNFEVQYKARVTNLVPDMLSRMPMENLVGIEDPGDDVVANIIQGVKPLKQE